MFKYEIDINADIGEGFGSYCVGDDLGIMSYVTSVNIACGFHAGDYMIMDQTIKHALEAGVKIGAHPGYPDRYGFGRRPMVFSHEEIRAMLIYQIGALKALVECAGGHLHHVKLHGALYHAVSRDKPLADVVAKTIYDIDPDLVIYGLSGSQLIASGVELGLSVKNEVFADRRYRDSGDLLSRNIEGSVLKTEADVLDQVQTIIESGCVITDSGYEIKLEGETICVHGDTVESLALAKAIYEYLSIDLR